MSSAAILTCGGAVNWYLVLASLPRIRLGRYLRLPSLGPKFQTQAFKVFVRHDFAVDALRKTRYAQARMYY